jgi:type I restriction enzyme, R subunit
LGEREKLGGVDYMKYNEDSRVKIPALLHFKRLGYDYQSKKNVNIDSRNNIFVDVFKDSIRRLNNKEFDDDFLNELIKEIATLTENAKDKGMSFFGRLVEFNNVKLIDLKQPQKNDFRVVTELTFKRGNHEGFRPDITILVNGIPLGFVEVKKPNNRNGIQEEFDRMREKRLKPEEHIPFMNQFQVLGFTNNLPYNDEAKVKRQGSFYTTPNGLKTSYNHFREEREIPVSDYIDNDYIDYVLSDNGLLSIKETAEFITNLKPTTHANKFITSLFSKERLIFLLRYGIVYVDSPRDGLEKHIIRYPQFFAIQELIEKIRNGMMRGIVWHTQGSGKTSLAYFVSNVLRDYYQELGIITKFYFVVDRLDLLIQGSSEFSSRGMTIANINSREDFKNNIKSTEIVSSSSQSGKYVETMNVVNIHKFSEESTAEYAVNKNIQRIYFLDEVHRSYKPKGTFLANLLGSDPNGIFIGLTGTPILKKEFKSTDLFDEYIHKYYYNKSIADGYTLKMKKENISIQFKNDVRKLLKVEEGKKIPAKDWALIMEDDTFVEKLCEYIEEDFNVFRDTQRDQSLGFMIVTASSEQARKIQGWFNGKDSLKTALVLYDEDYNKDKQEEYRGKRNKDKNNAIESKYDGVIVFNMLLTGFDAPRLKRLYLLREIKEHSLLQTLARVNRPYKNLKYGHIVDFVDITEEYEETIKRYMEELRDDLGGEDGEDVDTMIVNVDKVKAHIEEIENQLFIYMANIENNLESFQEQLQPLGEKQLREIKSSLEEYKECYNELRMSHEDVSEIPIDRINKAFYEVSNRINIKVAERIIDDPGTDISDIDLSQLIVEFLKIGEMDLEFTTDNDILERFHRIQNSFSINTDKEDEEFLNLQKRLKEIVRSFRKENNTADQIHYILTDMDVLYRDSQTLNMKNEGLTSKYKGNFSYMRIHKKLVKQFEPELNDLVINQVMNDIITEKEILIGHIHQPTESVIVRQLKNPVRKAFKSKGISLSLEKVEEIIHLFIKEMYIKQ